MIVETRSFKETIGSYKNVRVKVFDPCSEDQHKRIEKACSELLETIRSDQRKNGSMTYEGKTE